MHGYTVLIPLLTLEVVSSLTRIVRAGALTRAESGAVLDAYAALPVTRRPSRPLWRRIADVSDRHSAYDAADVVLAEALDAPLLTTDERLVRAVTTVEVIAPSRAATGASSLPEGALRR